MLITPNKTDFMALGPLEASENHWKCQIYIYCSIMKYSSAITSCESNP